MRHPSQFSIRAALTALAAWCLIALPAGAQEVPKSPVLVIESERLFAETLAGQDIIAALDLARDALVTENSRIESDLEAEEQDLTQRRETLNVDEFRALAEAFDARVQSIRQQQDAKARALSQRFDRQQVDFRRAIAPVLQFIMTEAGAVVMIERRNTFITAEQIDVTDLAIRRIDQALTVTPTAPGTDPAPEPEN